MKEFRTIGANTRTRLGFDLKCYFYNQTNRTIKLLKYFMLSVVIREQRKNAFL